MGISGLLPLLKPITTTVHVRDLRGLRIGVDAYVWLHKGAFGCAPDLCQGRPTKKYLNYCIERLNALLHAGAHVCLIFDGGPLPAKKGTEDERRARREDSRRKALQCLAEGKSGEAFAHFTKAVDVTPAFAKEWIRTLRGAGPHVSFVVAPYEADAQLAFLCRVGMLDAVVTEDSDILAFGCPRVLFKLEQDGTAQQILHADLFRAPIDGLGDLRAWDADAFLHMCIMSGCDYLPSVPGVGLRSAFRLLQRHGTADKALRALRLQQFGKGRATAQVPPDYEARFRQAFLTFRHQRVFDPRTQEMTHVHPLPPDLAALPPSELEYLGPPMEAAVAAGIANGELDPITLEPFASLSPSVDAILPGPGPTVAMTTAAAQPPISDYLSRLPARPPAPVRAVGATEALQEEEQEEEGGGEEGERYSSGKTARPVPIYQPGLRKSQQQQPHQHQPRHDGRAVVGGYLRRIAGATAHATAGLLLSRKRPAPPTALAPPAAAMAGDPGGEEKEEEQAAAMAAGGCLPQVSSWFSSKSNANGSSDDKENFVPAPLSAASYALPSKRPRTLGASARPAAWGLRGLARHGGGGPQAAESGAREEQGQGEEGRRGRFPFTGDDESDGSSGGGYEDSLQPPTPGTPFVPPQSSLPLAPLSSSSLPPPDEESEQPDDGAMGGSGTTMAGTSIFKDFAFEPPPREAQPAAAGAGGGGTGGGPPLPSLAPNTMTPLAHQGRGPGRGQAAPKVRVGTAAAAACAGGAEGPGAAARSVSVSMASFSFSAFEFSSSSAGPL